MKPSLLLTTLIAATIVCSCVEPRAKSDDNVNYVNRSPMPCIGDIEIVRKTIREYTSYEGDIEESITTNIYKFNQNGDILEETEYNDDEGLDFLVARYCYNYDSRCNQIEQIFYKEDGSLGWRELCKYDTLGNIIEGVAYNSEGVQICKKSYQYDSRGNLIEKIGYYDGGEKTKSMYAYQYDSQGNIVEKTECDNNGKQHSRDLYRFDSQGNMIEACLFGADNQLRMRIVYKHDLKGNVINEVVYNKDGAIHSKRIYEYYSRCDIVDKVCDYGKVMQSHSIEDVKSSRYFVFLDDF